MTLEQWMLAKAKLQDAYAIFVDGDYQDQLSSSTNRVLTMIEVALEAMLQIRKDRQFSEDACPPHKSSNT